MENNFVKFSGLHHTDEPLLVFNVWNVQSAKIAERCGAKAIATSSGAVAETLGYADGEQMSFQEYRFVIERICRTVSLPFSVDLESGYGATVQEVVGNIEALVKVGVAGINIEDSILRNGKRVLLDADVFASRLNQITEGLRHSKTSIFINVRCDVFLVAPESAVDEGVKRSLLYAGAGANGLFFPGLTKADEIKIMVNATSLPVNVIGSARLPEISALKRAGVKRVSMGPFLNKLVYKNLEDVTQKMVSNQTLSCLFQTPA